MKEQRLNKTVDSLLAPLLVTRDETESQRLLDHLIADHILPVSKEIIYHKLGAHFSGHDLQDSEDVQNNVVLKLLSTLRECKHDPDGRTISNFRSYVAVTTYNACNEYLRQRYPQRNSLKNQLRYVFTHVAQLAMWINEDGKALCGRVENKNQKAKAAAQDKLNKIAGSVRTLGLDDKPLIETAIAILKLLDGPVELDDLVSLVAEAKGIKDEAAQSDDAASLLERIADGSPRIDQSLEQRIYLKRLWKEISELPLRQRMVLLLNLKDAYGGSQLEMLPFTGVATIRQIARVLEMDEEEFATLWYELPIEDAQIAERLDLTRQQVINLRKSARQRLARRMKESAF